MKTIKLIISIFILVLMHSNAWADGKKHQEQLLFSGLDTAPAKVVSQFHKALADKKGAIARSLLDDNVLIYEGGRVERSAEEYAHHHMLADMKYVSSVDIKVLDQQVKINGDVAVSTARTKTKGTYKGKSINSNGMETIVLNKINGQWKITHIHWSN